MVCCLPLKDNPTLLTQNGTEYVQIFIAITIDYALLGQVFALYITWPQDSNFQNM
jgi:hypothetical protein